MERYGLSYEAPEDIRNAPFVFTLIENNRRIGFRYEDFGLDDDVNQIIQDCNLDEAIILRAWLSGKAEEWIDRENSHFINDGVKLKSVLLETFFKQYFGADEYNSFLSHINDFLQKAKDITGYKSIKFLSTMNLAMLKLFEEKELIRKSGCAWGCDICQNVCPLNKNAGTTGIEEFIASSQPEVTLDTEIEGRAFAWRGEKVIKRNLELLEDDNGS